MSGVDGIAPRTTNYDASALDGPKTLHNTAANTNSVGQSSPSQGSSSSSPTSSGTPTADAREATTAQRPTAGDVERMTDERVRTDPKFLEAEVSFHELEQAEADFRLIDGETFLGRNDNIITYNELLDIAANENASADARAAANRLIHNPSLWNQLATNLADGVNDNKVGVNDVTRLKREAKGYMDSMRAEVKGEVKAEIAAASGAATGTGAAPATGAVPATGGKDPAAQARADAVMAQAGEALPKPPPSQFGGLEGASENLNNMVGWAEAETDRLTTLMGQTDDPAVLKQLEAKINQMSRRMQQMTALMNQIMTAMQNISKMYSDIAMNSVRNMK